MSIYDDRGASLQSRYVPTRRVVVIGAGIAGLTAAYYLNKHGYDVRMFEREQAVGGMIRTSWREDKYLLEHGPNAYSSSSEHIMRLSRELSLDRLELKNNSTQRFIYWNGALRPLPTGPLSLLSSKLLSASGKARMLVEPLIRSQSHEGETIASFVRRRAGMEVLETLANSFVSDIWAGDPEELEVGSVFPHLCAFERKYGSVMRGITKERHAFGIRDPHSYRWGMGTLPARIEEVLRRNIKLGVPVNDIICDADGRLFVYTNNGARRLETDAIVIATPPHVAAGLLERLSPRASIELYDIKRCSIAVIHTAFKKKDVDISIIGSGYLVPRITNVRILETLFSSTLFDHRAPHDEVLFTTFIGGATDSDAIDLDDEELLREVRKGLHTTLGVDTKPEYAKITRLKNALPQYTVGHAQRIKRITKEMEKTPGLYLTGNYFSGISISDTIGHARQIVDNARVFLSRPKIRKINGDRSRC